MITEKVDSLKIELVGAEVDQFKKALAKVVDEANRAGFHQCMDSEEKKVLQDLHEKIK